MKNVFILFTLVLAIMACQQKKETTKVLEAEPVNKIIGTWKMVYADIKENDSLQIKDLSKSEFVKIINESHFAFFNQDHTDATFFMEVEEPINWKMKDILKNYNSRQ